jgi:hypothetical protein
MAQDNLFDDGQDDAQEKAKMEAQDKRLKELEEKLGGIQGELEKSKKSWSDERTQLEQKLEVATKRAAAADSWDKTINDNPIGAAKMIIDYAESKRGVNRGGANDKPNTDVSNEKLTAMEQRQAKLEKDLQDRAAKEYIVEMQNSIAETIDELKEYGIEADPKVIIQHLQENDYTKPNQVRDATFGLYREQVISNASKKRKDRDEPVVMGTQGYPAGSGNEDEAPVDIEKTDINDLWNTVASKLK